MNLVTFTSDFGLEDEWVAACKGVIKRIAPKIGIIDISHQVPSYNIRKGALILAGAVTYMPVGVHLAVVDPAVGTSRKAVALQVGRGDFLVGPDNGLLILAAERLGGILKAAEITNEDLMLKPVCPTFHGRDIFAPIAAYLAKGFSIEKLGPAIDPQSLVEAPFEKPKITLEGLECEAIDIDKFGTIRLNCTLEDLKKIGITHDKEVLVKLDAQSLTLPFLKSFGEVQEGEALLLIDSSNFLCIAVNQGSAALHWTVQGAEQIFGLRLGDKIKLAKISF